jgi:hypothetical protein
VSKIIIVSKRIIMSVIEHVRECVQVSKKVSISYKTASKRTVSHLNGTSHVQAKSVHNESNGYKKRSHV